LPLKEDGKFAGLLFSARDITSRKKSEEAMTRLVERFDLATHAANLGVWDRDLQTNELLWDNRMFELYGVKKDDFSVSYESWLHGIHPDDAACTQEEIQQALYGRKDLNTEFRIIHPDGAIRNIRTYGKVTRDASGKPLRMTGINYDITEHKLAENKLRESEKQYRSLFTEISEGFALHEIICDESGKPVDYRFLNINPAFEKITPFKADDVIGKCVRQILPQTEEIWIEKYGHVALTGQPVSFEMYAKELDRHYQVNAFSPQKGQFAVLFTDITERKNMEAQLIQAQKMEAIGTLAGGIAHDFNNILGAIIGYADMAQEELPQDSPTLECIDEILRAGERAKKLVEQILAFSRRHDAERKPLLMVPLIKEIVKLLRPMLPSTIRIKQNIQVQDPLILADATQIHQVLMNLCTNAAHAMQEKGGTLTIGLKPVTVQEEDPLLSGHLAAGNYLELQVADDGHGINEKIQHLIFDPFFTTKRTGEGTGMGLSVVHGIVKSYGGHIRLESKVGEGTSFFIYLPLLHEQATQENTQKTASATGGTERILLIDDQDFMLEMMSRSLSRLGYRVTAQESSRDALQLFQSDPLAFDLVITDQTMPFLTGADMASEMLQIRPDIPIILCTGYSSTISPEQAEFIGIREYVMKPVVMSDFTRLIRKTLKTDSGSLMDEGISMDRRQ
jgi:PAS domain S-box-containing protein